MRCVKYITDSDYDKAVIVTDTKTAVVLENILSNVIDRLEMERDKLSKEVEQGLWDMHGKAFVDTYNDEIASLREVVSAMVDCDEHYRDDWEGFQSDVMESIEED